MSFPSSTLPESIITLQASFSSSEPCSKAFESCQCWYMNVSCPTTSESTDGPCPSTLHQVHNGTTNTSSVLDENSQTNRLCCKIFVLQCRMPACSRTSWVALAGAVEGDAALFQFAVLGCSFPCQGIVKFPFFTS